MSGSGRGRSRSPAVPIGARRSTTPAVRARPPVPAFTVQEPATPVVHLTRGVWTREEFDTLYNFLHESAWVVVRSRTRADIIYEVNILTGESRTRGS